MNLENETMNIPGCSVSEAVDLLTAYYTATLQGNLPLSRTVTPFLWGPAGVGKSQGVHQLAERLEQNTGKQVHVTDIRLLLFNPVDLRGIPVANAERSEAVWLMPSIFKMNTSPDVVNILFLDELSAAPQSVQAAAYQICLDRKIGEHTLPANCIVIAAGNRTTDQSVSYKMPKALCNRLAHFNIRPDMESWRAWALSRGIDRRIIGFLAFDHSSLCVTPGTGDHAYPTPRSWEFVSGILQTMQCTPTEAHSFISGCIGLDTALRFETWCAGCEDLPTVEAILAGDHSIRPRSNDALCILVAGLSAAIREKGDRITQRALNNAFTYLLPAPDFCKMFYLDLTRDNEAMRIKLMTCEAVKRWQSNR